MGGDREMPVPVPTAGSKGSDALQLLKDLPPEAVVKVFDVVGDVVRMSAEVRRDNQAFVREMEALARADASVERRLEYLKTLVLSGQLSEEAQLKPVDAICQVVVK